MKKSFIFKEASSIFKNSKLLIAISAVIIVPILYAGMFLWAFWDPYDHLTDLPVAIVNSDEGYFHEDEQLELGDELVDKLIEDPEFDFHVVSRDEGYKGLQDQDYYVLIEIPENFSKNSTTIMDDQPEKLDLIYMPNESYNFLASQIGETAMLHIEMALEEKITETYAETIFENIDEVADGLQDASEATEELNDGASELKDGSEKIKDNLITLASKSIDFTNGMETAKSGTNDLADGSNKLADGMNQLNDGSNQLLDASKEVQEGSNKLADGISQANDGLQEMSGKVPQLVDGTNQVQEGLTQFQNELPKQMAGKIGEQLEASSKAMNDGLDELETGIVGGLEDGLKNQMAPQLSDGLTTEISKGIAAEVAKGAGSIPDAEQISNQIASQITPVLIQQQEEQVKNMFAIMQQVGIPEEQIGAVQEIVANNQPDVGAIEASIANELKAGIENEIPNIDISADDIAKQIGPGITEGINQAVDKTVSQTTTAINEGFNEYKTAVNEGLGGAASGLEDQIAEAVNPAFNQLNGGLSTINDGQKALQGGVDQLADGTKQLKDGSNQLASGQGEYVSNMQLFTSKFSEANQGTNELANGANQLFNGMLELEDGSFKLSDGTQKLADGSKDLDKGMDKLVDGTDEFHEKMSDAATEAKDINSTEDTYNMMANPVEVANEKINKVPNYGTGFAPYFLSLGLFVGALLLSIVYPLREAEGTPKSGLNWFLGKFTVLFGIGILQALIASGFLLIVLGIEVQSVPLFILYSIITSLVFVTLIQFLVTCLDDPGRFIAIIILILQLTTSAGTFPLELIPKAIQPLNAILPMTYSVEGFKAVISSGEFGVMWINAFILLGFALVFMLLTLSYFVVMFKRKFGAIVERETA